MSGRQPTAGPSRIKHHQPTSSQAPPPSSSLSAFNSSRTHYACAQPVLGAADKVTVWDVASDRVVGEWDVEHAGKVSTLCWTSVAGGSRKAGKRRRKSGANNEDADDVVLIATKASHLVVYSPRQAQVVRKLNLPSTATAIWSDENGIVATTSTSVLVVSPDLTSVTHAVKLPPNTPAPTAITILASSTPEILYLLVGSMAVVSLHLELASSSISHTSSPLPVSTSSVTSLTPLPVTSQGASFLAVSEDDRTVSQYTITSPTKAPKLSYRYASPTLSPAHSVALSSTHLSVLHQSGEVSLFSLPTELDFARPKSDSKPASLKLVEGKAEQIARLSRVDFAPVGEGESGALLCGRMVGAGRIKWHKAVYELPEGGVRASTVVKCEAQDLVNKANGSSVTTQRFSAPTEVPEMPDADIDEPTAAALPNDVDMADLSLGERLLALPNGDSSLPNGDAAGKDKTSAAAAAGLDGPVNAASLTRLLVQALHTSDPALLTLCLSHRDSVLIRNTIRKMPAQMALPLLKACVERLGQGKGANRRGGGRGSAQSEQQARGTVEWVKGVLVERGSILMTMPSLPLHLANLSQLLQTRLQLYQPLLSLSGRLDLALAQIQLRQQAALHAEGGERKGAEGRHYVEGESDDDDSDDDVAIEVGDGDGEIEDIDMRDIGSELDDSDEDDDDEDDEEDEDEDEEDDDEDPLDSGSEQGYLDLEAEEDGSDEEEDSEEE